MRNFTIHKLYDKIPAHPVAFGLHTEEFQDHIWISDYDLFDLFLTPDPIIEVLSAGETTLSFLDSAYEKRGHINGLYIESTFPYFPNAVQKKYVTVQTKI